MNDNKLIAEFMGLESFKDSLASLHQGKINVDVDVYEQAQYHTSWDWLMPVVEKCLEKHNNLIDGRDVIDTSYSSIAQALQVVSLKETYKAVVKFIKTYNNESRNI
jgi:hypothetical protein